MADNLMSGIGSGFSGVGSVFQSIFYTIGHYSWIFLFIIAFFCIMYYVWYNYYLFNRRASVMKANGGEVLAKARMVIDKNTKQRKFIVKGFSMHDGQPPDESLFFNYKASVNSYLCVRAIQDNYGLLHFTDRKVASFQYEEVTDGLGNTKRSLVRHEGIEWLQVINPSKIEQYLTSIGRAYRKFKMTPEKLMQLMIIMIAVIALILMAGLSWGYYQQQKMATATAQSMNHMADVLDKSNEINERLGMLLSLQGVNVTKLGSVTNNSPAETETIITPFNNVIK